MFKFINSTTIAKKYKYIRRLIGTIKFAIITMVNTARYKPIFSLKSPSFVWLNKVLSRYLLIEYTTQYASKININTITKVLVKLSPSYIYTMNTP